MKLRMIEIRNEIEVLENPVLRRTYEGIHFKVKSNNNNTKFDEKPNVYIVNKPAAFEKQMEYFDAARKLIDADQTVQCVPSLQVKKSFERIQSITVEKKTINRRLVFQNCLKLCMPRDYIYLPPGQHSVKWLEPLNSSGLLKAVTTATITTEESDNVLLSINGDYTIENVILDCQQVRFGIWNKSGTITLKNCQLIGDRSSSGIGIAITGK